MLSKPSREIPFVPLDQPTSVEEILTTFDQSISTALDQLSSWDEQTLLADWKMTQDGQTVMILPRLEMVRSTMLNHWYHHRGQLTFYLRLLDVPVPAVYGPSADEK